MLLRTLLMLFVGNRQPKLGIEDVSRMTRRVLPNDLDVQGHVNNGVYFSLMDLGRMELLMRAGVWRRMRKAGVYPVVASETMTFRKSLKLWNKYTLETRVIGYDEKAAYIEQRFVMGGEIYVQAFLRGRFLKNSGGVVSMAELGELFEVDVSAMRPPEWIERWASDVALPSTRAEAPSVWP